LRLGPEGVPAGHYPGGERALLGLGRAPGGRGALRWRGVRGPGPGLRRLPRRGRPGGPVHRDLARRPGAGPPGRGLGPGGGPHVGGAGLMRPLRLVVEGLRSYRNRQEIDFENTGLFAITGPTGAGKSSILEALVFALYHASTFDKSNV